VIVTQEQAAEITCLKPELAKVCKGSKCMAWRWHTETTGYCGVAGPPGKVAKGRVPKAKP
jgi:hypothetical protein